MLRIVGFGLDDYMSDKGLVFDAVIVIGSVVNKFSNATSGMELFRIFRSMRVLLVARGAGQSMQHLLAAVGQCQLKSTDIILVNLLIIYLFAIAGMRATTRFFKSVHITLEKRDPNVQLRLYVKHTKLAYPVKMHSLHKYATAIHIICNLKNWCTQPFVLKYWQKLHQRSAESSELFERSNWRPPFVPIY